jgi:hypothetical protein
MDERVATILNELKQICEQYKSEVPSRRRAWPQSIKKRILELRRLGVGASSIAEATLIPIQTIYSWQNGKSDDGTFLPVPVVKRKKAIKSPTVTVRRKRRPLEKPPANNQSPPTVTVVTPSGYRLEGLTYQMLRELLIAVEAGGGR